MRDNKLKVKKSQPTGKIIKTTKFRLFAAWLVAGALVVGCGDKKTIDFGEVQAGIYTNSFFNLRLSLPDSWHVLDLESRMELMKRGGQIVAGDNKNLKAAVDAADLNSLNLLAANESPPGSAVPTNPGIMLIAEKVKHLPGIKRGSDYHFQSKKLLQLSQMQISYPQEIYETNIDGISFDVMETEITIGPGAVVRQRQYATIMNSYALLVVLTYQDEYGLGELERIVETITFN